PPALYALSLHDALPIWTAARIVNARRMLTSLTDAITRCKDTPSCGVHYSRRVAKKGTGASMRISAGVAVAVGVLTALFAAPARADRKSTRLNSSHVAIS